MQPVARPVAACTALPILAWLQWSAFSRANFVRGSGNTGDRLVEVPLRVCNCADIAKQHQRGQAKKAAEDLEAAGRPNGETDS